MKNLKEIAQDAGVPESTLRLYRDEFEELVPASGSGRRRRYEAEGEALLRQIVEWKRAGWTSVRIRDELKKTRQPRHRARQRNLEERLDELSTQIAALHRETVELRAEIGALRSAVAELRREPGEVFLTFEDAVSVTASNTER
ncbi:MAG: hypothetical protein OHK0029_10640 [Armatimonadaceae bacterium]